MSSWTKYKLEEVVSFSQGFQISTDQQYSNCQNGMNRFIRIVDYTNPNEEPRYIKDISPKYWVNANDVVMIRYGSNTAGKVVRGFSGYIANNMFKVNVCDENFLNKEFLYYFLSQPLIYEYLMSSQSSSTMPAIKFGDLYKLDIFIPPMETQLNIVDYLNVINDKIELNTQINQTLEQIAQTIFKSWFIDFDPVHAKANALASGQTLEQATQAAMAVISGKNTQELHRLQTANPEQYQQLWEIAEAFPSGVDESGVPWGWSIKYFKDITSLYIDNRGKTPPIEESGIPLLEVKHLPENSIFPNLKTEKYISDDTYDSWLRQKLEPLDVVISTVGTIGRISLIPFNKKVAIAQNILGFRFKQDITNQVFMFYQMKSHKFNFDVEARLVETVQKSIKRKDLETIPLIIPDLKLQTFFEKMVLPAILKQDNENETLENIRDQLLPKLLSGELNGLSEKTI